MQQIKLFERNSNDYEYVIYKYKMVNQLHFKNLIHLNRKKIKGFFVRNETQHFLRYRFEILRNWIRQNEIYSQNYINSLDKIIHKLYLTNELCSYEKEYLNHYHGIVFAKTRNLKNLIIDFPINKNEKVYYKYENASLYKFVNKKMILIQNQGEIFITTQKILLSHHMNIYPIEFENIKDYKISPYGLMILIKNQTYIFKTYDDFLTYVSLERIFKLRKIIL
ncbi:MAG: hypothetical protein LBF00_00630 [Mycoplasmataceae bacterium]|jgi:hypothetical protein|nr:hypothetical protein [Mycoplasmataceae bacterium]